MPEVKPVVVHERDLPVERSDDGAFGAVAWRTLFSGDRTPTGALTVGVADVAPGATGESGLHRHEPAEIYYVVQGQGSILIGDMTHPLEAGSAVFIPPNTWHVARNTGSDTLRLLYVFPADSFSEVIYEFPTDGSTPSFNIT